MTNWITFFRILTIAPTGRPPIGIPLQILVRHPDEHMLANHLQMVPLPEGHHNTLTPQAIEWMQESTT